jgi:hypothetical protein
MYHGTNDRQMKKSRSTRGWENTCSVEENPNEIDIPTQHHLNLVANSFFREKGVCVWRAGAFGRIVVANLFAVPVCVVSRA